jgi:ribosomal protein L10
MSKFVKDLMCGELAKRLEGVDDALLVNVIGLDANSSTALRRELRNKGIELMVVKNSIARRATLGTSLEAAFDPITGPLALVWGAEDFISLTKEVVRINKDGTYKEFATRGGVMDGEHLTAERVHEISKWPNREGMLSILAGQILAPGSDLASQLESAGNALASQIEKIADGETGAADGETGETSEAGGETE